MKIMKKNKKKIFFAIDTFFTVCYYLTIPNVSVLN